MRAALAEARAALATGDVPIGAVVVDAAGEFVGRGRNVREAAADPTRYPDAGEPWAIAKVYYTHGFPKSRLQLLDDELFARDGVRHFEEFLSRWGDRPDIMERVTTRVESLTGRRSAYSRITPRHWCATVFSSLRLAGPKPLRSRRPAP